MNENLRRSPLERRWVISVAVHRGKPRWGLQAEITEDQITDKLSSSLSLDYRPAYLGAVLPTVGSGLLANPLTELPQMILGCVLLKIKLARTCIFQSFYDTGRRTLKRKKEKRRREKEKKIQSSVKFAVIRDVPEWRPVGASKGLRNEDICLPSPQWYRRRKVTSKFTGKPPAFPGTQAFLLERVKVHLTNIINRPKDGQWTYGHMFNKHSHVQPRMKIRVDFITQNPSLSS